jgi:hypothetical protein
MIECVINIRTVIREEKRFKIKKKVKKMVHVWFFEVKKMGSPRNTDLIGR